MVSDLLCWIHTRQQISLLWAIASKMELRVADWESGSRWALNAHTWFCSAVAQWDMVHMKPWAQCLTPWKCSVNSGHWPYHLHWGILGRESVWCTGKFTEPDTESLRFQVYLLPLSLSFWVSHSFHLSGPRVSHGNINSSPTSVICYINL